MARGLGHSSGVKPIFIFLEIGILIPLFRKVIPFSIRYTAEALFVGVEGPKTPAPPLQPIPLMLQRHWGMQFVVYTSAINVTEAISEFLSFTRDMKGGRVIFGHF